MSKFGVTVKDVPADKFIRAYAEQLKRSDKVQPPKWADLVKTAAYKQLPPQDADWWYIRAASMARRLYIRGSIGVGAFRKIYGGNKDNGTCPDHFAKASGSILRTIMHQLEDLGIIARVGDSKNSMRKLTKEGQRDLDRIASSLVSKKQ